MKVKTYSGERDGEKGACGRLWRRVLKCHLPCNFKKTDVWKLNEKEKSGKEWKESSDCLLTVWGANGFQMCLLYFQRSIKHSLSEESKQRLEFTDWKSAVWTKRWSHVRSCYKNCMFYILRQACILFFHFWFLYFPIMSFFLSLWECCNGCKGLSGGGVYPYFLCKPWGNWDLDEVRSFLALTVKLSAEMEGCRSPVFMYVIMLLRDRPRAPFITQFISPCKNEKVDTILCLSIKYTAAGLAW